jgi:hypothetical protein
MSHPFLPDCHTSESPTAEVVHRSFLDVIATLADDAGSPPADGSGPGRCLRLTGPRAGSGKTHLLARLGSLAPGRWNWIPLGPDAVSGDVPGSWAELTRSALRALLSAPSGPGNPTSAVDPIAWFASSRLVLAGVDNGTIRTRNPEESRRRLEQWRSLFDPSAPDSRSEWFLQAAPSLLGPCAKDAARSLRVDPDAFREWFGWLSEFGYAPVSAPDRADRLEERLSAAQGPERSWKARFHVLARLASGVHPVLWVADDLDRLVVDPEAARRFPALLAELRATVPRSLLLLSVNEDFWDSWTRHGMTEAIRDRLSETELSLPGLPLAEAEALVHARLRNLRASDQPHATRFLATLDLPGLAARGPVFPRDLIRLARRTWDETQCPSEAAPAASLPPSPSPATVRARDQLHALAEAIRLQGTPVDAVWRPAPPPGDHAPDPATFTSAPPEPNHPAPERPATLPDQFQERRLHHLRQDSLAAPVALPLVRLQRLLAAVGQRFPSVRQRIAESGPDPAEDPGIPPELVWTLLNRELHFGFAPASAVRPWSRLLASAWQDRESAIHPRPFKVVWFAPPGGPSPLASAEAFAEQGLAPALFRATPLDRVEIDPELAATLLAAADLVDACPPGAPDSRERLVFGFLARELDFFWRRLTRPVPEWGGSGVRAPAMAGTGN